ncbi:hypothetical protein HCH_06660 [Hahella chejuensis KCTC 2396]|uniref:Uncharacterized protein n=1 Tax=Hahella chejuensis (strain KCTC 2396) TaxID=349521 RepID=Q2S7T1_HAHCH|nr:hypothetical protein [Hahella chejuensis]ABC33293.1 hypothetical protein HCH_06660 [Hahella chejuensis KCTC 2396]
MKRYFYLLPLSLSLSACVQWPMGWERGVNDDNRPASQPGIQQSEIADAPVQETHALVAEPQAASPEYNWLDYYLTGERLSQEERSARLLALESLLAIPQDSIPVWKVHLQRATLLAALPSGPDNWRKAMLLIDTIPESEDGVPGDYVRWLKSELKFRLDGISSSSQLRRENARLERQVDQLRKKIEALTNIEQNLTEKKETQDQY